MSNIHPRWCDGESPVVFEATGDSPAGCFTQAAELPELRDPEIWSHGQATITWDPDGGWLLLLTIF